MTDHSPISRLKWFLSVLFCGLGMHAMGFVGRQTFNHPDVSCLVHHLPLLPPPPSLMFAPCAQCRDVSPSLNSLTR